MTDREQLEAIVGALESFNADFDHFLDELETFGVAVARVGKEIMRYGAAIKVFQDRIHEAREKRSP